jgi:hypothetical protein
LLVPSPKAVELGLQIVQDVAEEQSEQAVPHWTQVWVVTESKYLSASLQSHMSVDGVCRFILEPSKQVEHDEIGVNAQSKHPIPHYWHWLAPELKE